MNRQLTRDRQTPLESCGVITKPSVSRLRIWQVSYLLDFYSFMSSRRRIHFSLVLRFSYAQSLVTGWKNVGSFQGARGDPHPRSTVQHSVTTNVVRHKPCSLLEQHHCPKGIEGYPLLDSDRPLVCDMDASHYPAITYLSRQLSAKFQFHLKLGIRSPS